MFDTFIYGRRLCQAERTFAEILRRPHNVRTNQNKSLEAPFIQALQVICLFIVRMWWGRLTISAKAHI